MVVAVVEVEVVELKVGVVKVATVPVTGGVHDWYLIVSPTQVPPFEAGVITYLV